MNYEEQKYQEELLDTRTSEQKQNNDFNEEMEKCSC